MTDTSYSHAIKLDNYRQTSINKGFDVSPDTIEEGERLYDFFPIASHIICTPGKTHERHAPCLPALQKRYADLSSESKAALQNVLEESACLNFLTARI